MEPDISVVHVVGSLHPSAGGPSRTVVQLTDGLAQHNDIDVFLLSQSMTGQPTVQSKVNRVRRHICETSSKISFGFGLPLRRALIDIYESQRPSLIHNHGLWLPANVWTVQKARKEKVIKEAQFSALFIAFNTFKLWDKKFDKEKGFYICLERI